MRRLFVLSTVATCWLGCSVPGIELDNRACPCADEEVYFCDTARNTCEKRAIDSGPLLEESFEDGPGALDARATSTGQPWATVEGSALVSGGAAFNTNVPFTAYVDVGATLVRIDAELMLPPRLTTERWLAGTVVGANDASSGTIVDGVVVRVDHDHNAFTLGIEDWFEGSMRSLRVRRLFGVLGLEGGRIRIVQITSQTGVIAYIDGQLERSMVVLPLTAPLTGTNVGITVHDANGAVNVRWEHLRVLANIVDTTPPAVVTDLHVSGGRLEWTRVNDNLELWGYQMSRRNLTGSDWEGPMLVPDAISFTPGAEEAVQEGYWPGDETEAHVLAFDTAGNVSRSEPLRYTLP